MKKLKDLINTDLDINITGITDDSREVRDGYIFVATKGYNVDHYDYIDDAISRGCSFVVSDREISIDFPHIIVDKIDEYYKELCIKFYDIDLSKHRFIGITGTDGKTTTATIINRLIDNSSYIGTNGLTIDDKNYSTNNTTPCISELYKDLSIIEKNNSDTTVMEVSSEALLHNRVDNFKFDVVVFTNITGDHLSVHGSFENYKKSKLKLLDLVCKDGYVVANGDDENLKGIKHSNLYTFGFDNDNYFTIENVNYMSKSVLIDVKYEDKKISIESPLKGKYNVYNVVSAYIVGHLLEIDDSLLLKRIKELSPIKGRCEFIDFNQEFDIVLDYAHTINGIKSILETFKDYENIIVVTGCAGGRDHDKRSVIGDLVINNSDVAIFTMDDPRYEDVNDIIDEMVGNNKDYIRIIDREEAINYALSIATPNSVILILGKGRDNYMAIEDKKIKYNDYDVIKKYFNES